MALGKRGNHLAAVIAKHKRKQFGNGLGGLVSELLAENTYKRGRVAPFSPKHHDSGHFAVSRARKWTS